MTVTPAAPPSADGLTPEQVDLQQRARRFVDEVLIPNEELAERSGGRLSGGADPAHQERGDRRRACPAACTRPSTAARAGRSPTGSSSRSSWGARRTRSPGTSRTPTTCWRAAPPEQIDRYLRPALRGELNDAYAVTEAEAGSDPSRIATTARKTDAGWVIDGEKWFVTTGDIASVYIVMANAIVDGEPLGTLFLVDRQLDGIEVVDDPPFTHTYPHGHPTIRFDGVEVGEDAVVGGLGGGDDLQRHWFTEERLGIAARGVGSMWRLLEDTTTWALEREQGGSRIMDYQGVSFPLADSAADAAAGRLLTLEVARLTDAGADPKLVHAKASMAKLFVSEAACRCADRCVQIFGGRGYMRTNVAERFLRELRVDRIWEGTSEIQRLIIARALERRGVERTLH